jgi:hypothetical protein
MSLRRLYQGLQIAAILLCGGRRNVFASQNLSTQVPTTDTCGLALAPPPQNRSLAQVVYQYCLVNPNTVGTTLQLPTVCSTGNVTQSPGFLRTTNKGASKVIIDPNGIRQTFLFSAGRCNVLATVDTDAKSYCIGEIFVRVGGPNARFFALAVDLQSFATNGGVLQTQVPPNVACMDRKAAAQVNPPACPQNSLVLPDAGCFACHSPDGSVPPLPTGYAKPDWNKLCKDPC